MITKILKLYKGFEIEKSYDENEDGTIDKESILYCAYKDGDFFDAKNNLAPLKRSIDRYTK